MIIEVLFVLSAFGAEKDKLNICGPGSHWVVAHHRRAYVKANGSLVKETDVRAHCQRNPSGYSEWNPKIINGLPSNWRIPSDKPSDFTVEQRERLLEALADLPDILKNQNYSGIYRGQDSDHPENPAASHGDTIVLYDAAFDSKHNLTEVLAHEMSHRYFDGLSQSEQDSFLNAAKWTNPDGSRRVTPGRSADQFLRPNGMMSYNEDFADDLAAYALNPKKLKATAPKIYEWMTKHIGPKIKKR